MEFHEKQLIIKKRMGKGKQANNLTGKTYQSAKDS
jgi:hypothetical protein